MPGLITFFTREGIEKFLTMDFFFILKFMFTAFLGKNFYDKCDELPLNEIYNLIEDPFNSVNAKIFFEVLPRLFVNDSYLIKASFKSKVNLYQKFRAAIDKEDHFFFKRELFSNSLKFLFRLNALPFTFKNLKVTFGLFKKIFLKDFILDNQMHSIFIKEKNDFFVKQSFFLKNFLMTLVNKIFFIFIEKTKAIFDSYLLHLRFFKMLCTMEEFSKFFNKNFFIKRFLSIFFKEASLVT